MNIKVDEEKLLELSAMISKQSDNMKDVCKSLSNITRSLASSWQGESYTHFVSTLLVENDSYVHSIELMASELQEIADYIQNAVSLYNKLDSEYQSQKIEL